MPSSQISTDKSHQQTDNRTELSCNASGMSTSFNREELQHHRMPSPFLSNLLKPGTEVTTTSFVGGNLYEPIFRERNGQSDKPSVSNSYRVRTNPDYGRNELESHQFLREIIKGLGGDSHRLQMLIVDPVFKSIIANPGFEQLARPEKLQLAEVAYRLHPNDLSDLHGILNTVAKSGFGSAMNDTDSLGNTLLSNIYHLVCNRELSPVLDKERLRIVSDMLHEINSPGVITQSNRGTCTVASLQHVMTENCPAEMVRLMTGLFSPTGRSSMAGGAELARATGTPVADKSSRSPIGRIFQSALMDWANGPDILYLNAIDAHIHQKTGRDLGTGLRPAQLKELCEQLFGTEHIMLELDQTSGQRDPVLIAHAEALINKTLYSNSLEVNLRRPSYMLVGLKWDLQQQHRSHHAVTLVDGPDNNRIYFRNSWGQASDPVHTSYSNPPIRLEIPERGIYSIAKDEFFGRLDFLITPLRQSIGNNGQSLY